MVKREQTGALGRAVTALRALTADPAEGPWVRVGASRALGLLADEPSVAELLTSFADDPGVGVSVQIAAAAALVELGQPDIAVQRLLRLAAEGHDSELDRVRLAILLYEHGEQSTALTLFDELKASMRHNDLLKHEVPMSLERLGERDAAVSCYSLVALDVDVEAFKRAHAVAALGRFDTKETVSTLLTLIRGREAPPEVRLPAASALCELGIEEDGVPALLDLTSSTDPDPFIALYAAQALLVLPERDRGVGVIARIAENRSLAWNVRVVAVRTLGDTGGSLASATVDGLVDDPDGYVRAETAISLGRLRSATDAVSLMLQLIAGSEIDLYWRRSLVDRLGELDDPRVSPALKRMAHDPNENDLVRVAAAARLATSPEDEEVALLAEFATDPSFGARVQAADRLSELGGQVAVDALDRMAHDAELMMYTDTVVYHLERIGGPAATSSLSGVASDPTCSALTRLNAAEVLISREPTVAVDALVDIARDPDASLLTRTKAISLLESFADRRS